MPETCRAITPSKIKFYIVASSWFFHSHMMYLGLLGGCHTHWTIKPLRYFEVHEILVEVLILELPDEL
jgi:hypothetical protein